MSTSRSIADGASGVSSVTQCLPGGERDRACKRRRLDELTVDSDVGPRRRDDAEATGAFRRELERALPPACGARLGARRAPADSIASDADDERRE